MSGVRAALGYVTGMSASAVGPDGRLSGPAGKMIAIAACVVCMLGLTVVAFVDGNEGKRSESKSVFWDETFDILEQTLSSHMLSALPKMYLEVDSWKKPYFFFIAFSSVRSKSSASPGGWQTALPLWIKVLT